MEYKKYVLAICLFSIALVLFSFGVRKPFTKNSAAQAAGGGTSLIGGTIEQSIICTCSANIALKIKGVTGSFGGDFIFQPGASQLFACYNIFSSGPWVLGTASGNAQCEQVRGEECEQDEQVPNGQVIQILGTSCE